MITYESRILNLLNEFSDPYSNDKVCDLLVKLTDYLPTHKFIEVTNALILKNTIELFEDYSLNDLEIIQKAIQELQLDILK